MPQRAALTALACCVTLATACARDVRVAMPGGPPEAPGSIEVVFTRPAQNVTVVVDRRLVVHDAHTERVLIRGIPPGMSELMVVAGSGQGRVERFQRVEIDTGRITTVPVAAPDRSMMADLPTTVVMVLAGIAMRLAYFALFE